MQNFKKKFKIELDSKENLQELLQILLDESNRNINEIQGEISKFANSAELKEETMDGKAKYAKAMNDYSTNKNKALSLVLDICKLMNDVIKNNGNVAQALEENNNTEDWGNFIKEHSQSETNEINDENKEYTINKK